MCTPLVLRNFWTVMFAASYNPALSPWDIRAAGGALNPPSETETGTPSEQRDVLHSEGTRTHLLRHLLTSSFFVWLEVKRIKRLCLCANKHAICALAVFTFTSQESMRIFDKSANQKYCDRF